MFRRFKKTTKRHSMYLNCKTYFSFRYGTLSSSQLVEAAADAGADTLALTNINATCDIWDFVNDCKKAGIKPIAGVEIRNENNLLYILLAANNEGFENINRFLSEHLLSKALFPDFSKKPCDVFNNPANGYVIYPMGAKEAEDLGGNERIGVLPSEAYKLLQLPFKKFLHAFVVRQPVTFLNKQSYNIHRLLRAIDLNTLLSRLPVSAVCSDQEWMKPPATLIEAFKNFPQVVMNTYHILENCHIEIDDSDKNKKVFSASAEDDRILLAKLAEDGFQFRYGDNDTAWKRMQKELAIINKLGFNAYFLITWDIIRYAQSRGFYYVGRGSGANSIVAYCLQITDVDPIELDLYFERFLNPYRTSPPDFDIDFSWLDRDEVIDYVFKRYGKEHVALLGMYTTFQYRAVVRELGKVFGLPKEEIDRLAWYRDTADDHIHQLVLKYGRLIENFPNHLSIHPGGMLISEKPLSSYGALFMPPKGFPTIQMDMFVAEHIGYSKLDILSQRGLGHIKECLRLVRQNKGVDVNIHAFQKFKNDPRVRDQIKNVNTIGCFYIESPAMRQLLQKLQCNDYLTLVAASSIIRPGVASSGMMRAYIERYHSPDKVDYIHPVMKELLEETYGVMVYQEDVIKVAHHFAGLDMGEADILRRAMSGKYRGHEEMARIKKKFFENCKERQYPDAITAEIWRQIESFGGYSFSKAHSASFAVESFQSLYLKTYYPKEFMVAVINNFGGFYNTELYFLELRKTGAQVHLPCVNESDYQTSICGNDVYTGFIHLKSLQQDFAEKIIAERRRAGRYLHLQDFIGRTAISAEQLNILINCGAFRFTGKSKKTLLWEANFLQKKNRVAVAAAPPIFKEPPLQFDLPSFSDSRIDDLFDQVELFDFPLCNPFEMADTNGRSYVSARGLEQHLGKKVTTLGYFIDHKSVTTVNKDKMAFGTFLDRHLEWIDTVHFPDAIRRQNFMGKGFYELTGVVVNDFGVYSIEVSDMKKIGYKKRKFADL